MTQPKKPNRLLNLDLGQMAFPLLLAILITAPYPRGLFFAGDLLPFHIACAGILLLAVLDDVIARRHADWGPEVYAAMAVPALYALSYFTAVDKHAAVAQALKYLNYFAVFYASSRLVSSPGRMRWMMRALVLGAFAIELVGLGTALKILEFPGAYADGTITSTFQYRNAFGGFLLAALVNGLALASSVDNPFESTLVSVVNFFTALSIITTYSRGTWIVLPLAVLTLVVLLPSQNRWKVLYSSVVSLSCSFLVLRKFLEAVGAGQTRVGVMWLALGAGCALVLEIVWIAGRAWVHSHGGDMEPKYRSLIIGLAVIYTVVLGGIYAAYAVDAYPNLMARIFPKQVVERADAIKADETSLTGRVDYIQDAMKIAGRSPLIGNGGGAWNALYHMHQEYLYWTTETHSHYFQMLTEVGVAGVLAFGLMWFYALRKVHRSVDEDTDPEELVTLIGGLVAIGAISVHAAVDFDLSVPANQYIVHALLGAAVGVAGSWFPEDDFRGRVATRIKVPILLGMVFILAFLPYQMYRAGHLGAQAARWLWAKNYVLAERYYKEAVALDPWNAGFYIDLAQAKLGTYFVMGDNRLVATADEYIQKALKMQPYDLNIRMKTVELYLMQARFAEAVAAADEVVRILPLDPKSYEGLVTTAFLAAQYNTDSGNASEARKYLDRALAVLPAFEQRVGRIPASAPRWMTDPTPQILFSTGQASAMNGQMDAAVKYLTRVRNDKSLGDEASVWLGVSYVKMGRVKEGQDILVAKTKARPELTQEIGRAAGLLGLAQSEVPR